MNAFIRVVPEEVEQHGPAAAIVLAHIRFRCASDGPGRIERDGHRWWRVSYEDLGREIGLSAKAVRGAVRTLRGAVSAKHFPPLSNQSRAFRLAASAEPSTSQKTERADADQPEDREGRPSAPAGISKCPTGQLHLPHRASALLTGEVEEGGEAAGSHLAAAPALSSLQSANGKPTYHPRCPDHRHVEYPPACGGCRRAREADQVDAVTAEERDAAERAEQRRMRDNCDDCDEAGWVKNEDGTTAQPGRKCSHPNLHTRRTA